MTVLYSLAVYLNATLNTDWKPHVFVATYVWRIWNICGPCSNRRLHRKEKERKLSLIRNLVERVHHASCLAKQNNNNNQSIELFDCCYPNNCGHNWWFLVPQSSHHIAIKMSEAANGLNSMNSVNTEYSHHTQTHTHNTQSRYTKQHHNNMGHSVILIKRGENKNDDKIKKWKISILL